MPTSRTFTRRFRNNRPSIAEGAAAAAAWLESCEIPEDAALLAMLALEELATNVVKYGYDDDGEHAIEIAFTATPDEFVIHFEDDGRAFDPLDAAVPPLGSPTDERDVGGLGLHLLRVLSDRFTYERRGGRNRVTLVKLLDG